MLLETTSTISLEREPKSCRSLFLFRRFHVRGSGFRYLVYRTVILSAFLSAPTQVRFKFAY